MTKAEFGRVYKTTRRRAVKLAASLCGREHAEDAVHKAAVYFLERLHRYQELTPSLFLQVVALRARHLRRQLMAAKEAPSGLLVSSQ